MINQKEMLELIEQYNSTDRKIIKNNLKRVMKKYKFRPKDIMQLGISKSNVYTWGNVSTDNIPMIDQSLKIAITFGFDVRELLKTS